MLTFNQYKQSFVVGQIYEGPVIRKTIQDVLPGWGTYKEVRTEHWEPIRTGRNGSLPSLWKFLG